MGLKKVVFDEIMIKEYPIILGDHPAVYVQFPTRVYREHPVLSETRVFSISSL